MGTATEVRLVGATKRYGNVLAADRLDLAVAPGEFVALLGPSGSGKTTALRLVAGFLQPDAGEVQIGGQVVNRLPPHRRNVGMVFQRYELFPHMTVADNVANGLKTRKVPKAEIARRVEEVLALVRLPDFDGRYPKQLSGGQQQRVALARAVVIDPLVLLLDEPLGALDKRLRDEMQIELQALQRRLGVTTIFVTHDQEEALTMADRIAVMNNGRIEQVGTPEEIYERPRNRFVAEFIGLSNFLPVKVQQVSADGVVAELDGGPLLRLPPAPGVTPGARLEVAIRPEKIAVLPAGSAPEGNATPAWVEHLVYQGEGTYLRARLANGLLVQAYAANDDASWFPGAGEREVVLAWKPESGRLLEGGG
ncbi:MAG: ABC transporter ATP-binding protein [Thermomicrobiales bacterium]|nr:ABC transporter ATP-binding protein [Thermomicrobiales bacterium]